MTEPGAVRMLVRALGRRCPRCGHGNLFHRWFTMVSHCPGCGMRFEREEGFFLGAYVMNYAAAALVVAVVLVVLIALEARAARTGRSADLVPLIVIGSIAAAITPVAFYPISKTLWTAIELIMRPLEVAEEAEATIARSVHPGSDHPGSDDPGSDDPGSDDPGSDDLADP